MGSLTALLNLSRNALNASQAALEITSNNVANANTPGYTQQVAIWTQNDTVSIGSSQGVGSGASVTAVSLRDRVLNQRIQQQTQLESSSAAEGDALTQLQSVFSLSSNSTTAASTTLGTDVNSFFNSLSALQADPSSVSLRQAILSAASTLASDFNGAANQITQQTSSLNQQISGTISKVNALTSSIATLNLAIESNSPNSDAGALEDQRQQDLTQLSQYIGFDQTKTEGNGITLTTADGALLVAGGQSYTLTTSPVNGNTNVISAQGQDLTKDLTGGAIGGMLQARDHDLPDASSKIDQLAYAIGSAVNAQNEAGLDANGTADVLKADGTHSLQIFILPANAPPISASAGAASTISVATTDTDVIAAASPGQGATGGGNATVLSTLANSTMLGSQTAAQFFASFLTQLGSSVSNVSGANTTQQASLTQLTTQQSSQSSVSLDQEAASLTQYERSYDAAAKVFSIVDQLMASALNLGEQTTVS